MMQGYISDSAASDNLDYSLPSKAEKLIDREGYALGYMRE